jgi:hypothetical protein
VDEVKEAVRAMANILVVEDEEQVRVFAVITATFSGIHR